MAVYRFRVTFEDAEDVYREIDIQGKQTFEDLHRAIQEAIGFDNTKDASFFMSDDFWHRGTEIALNEPSYNEDDDEDDRNPKPKPRRMSKCKVVEFIDDPHQKILYVFDPKAHWTFLIELVKIVNEDSKINYPKCTKTVGAAPKQYKVVIAPPVEDDEFDDLGDDEPAKERVFQAEEEYDTDHVAGDVETEGTDEESEVAAADGESEAEEEGGADDADMSAFEAGGEEDF
ncbi:MAG: hypothetical protein FD123_889 [Bacteroidetes bacterium]|nr:MAG: hypothetical protein FD123_889 [Bacteroidota bacterium]